MGRKKNLSKFLQLLSLKNDTVVMVLLRMCLWSAGKFKYTLTYKTGMVCFCSVFCLFFYLVYSLRKHQNKGCYFQLAK